jgi:hypothetical protein
MAILHSLDEDRNLTVFSVQGELSFEEQMAALRRFYDGTPTRNVIWDFRCMEGQRVSSEEMRKIISYIKRQDQKRPAGKTALVAATDLDFGLARMSQAYADQEELPWQIESFRTMEEAFIWIAEQ